jgi:hypothetical protein
MVYNTTYQFLARVKNITYPRTSWGIAGLTFWSKEENKGKRRQDQTIYTRSLTTFSVTRSS